MKPWLTLTMVAAAVAMAGTGCTTIYSEQAEAQVREQTEMERLRVDVDRLRERVQALEVAQQDVARQVEAGQGDTRVNVRQTAERVDQLERTMQAIERAREQDKQEIVDALSNRMATIMKSRAPAPSRPQRTSTGYEHTVKSGETLSAIAAAYGVKTEAIIKANSLQAPDTLRVGQVLFIPE